MSDPKPHHFWIEGPGRDYDYSTYCRAHWPAAIECAQAWLEEAADGAEIGAECSVRFKVRPGEPEFCLECGESQTGQGVTAVSDDSDRIMALENDLGCARADIDALKDEIRRAEAAMGGESPAMVIRERSEALHRAERADAEVARLRRENENLCVHGAEPTDDEWQALRAEVERLREKLLAARASIAEITSMPIDMVPFDVPSESNGGAS